MLRDDKERIVAELTERLRTSPTLIVADYRGLTMAELERVRGDLLQHGARFSVVKNTLTRRAAEAAGSDALLELLDGPTAIAFIEPDGDAATAAKLLNDLARATNVLVIKGGLIEGASMSATQVRSLATLPPADVLRAQLVGAIAAPLATVVGLFNAPLRDLVGVLDARIKQLEERGDGGTDEAPASNASTEEPDTSAPEASAETGTEAGPTEQEATAQEES